MVSRNQPIMSVSGIDGVTVDGIVFTEANTTAQGGGLSIAESEALISDCTFTSNTAQPGYWSGGAGIQILGSTPDVTVRDCVFSNNLIRTNYVYGSGAGLRAWGGNIRVERCLFTDNTAPLGAAVSTRSDNMEVVNCVFVGNRSILGSEGGGALATRNAVTTITHCTFHDNTTDNRGDAFIIRGADRFHLRNSVLADNGATAIYATNYDPCTITITNTLFHGHTTDLNSAAYLIEYSGNIATDTKIGGTIDTENRPRSLRACPTAISGSCPVRPRAMRQPTARISTISRTPGPSTATAMASPCPTWARMRPRPFHRPRPRRHDTDCHTDKHPHSHTHTDRDADLVAHPGQRQALDPFLMPCRKMTIRCFRHGYRRLSRVSPPRGSPWRRRRAPR